MDKNRSLLDNRERDLFLYRILCDELWYRGSVKLLIKSPTPKTLLKAQEVYNRTYNKCQKLEMYSQDDLLGMLMYDGIWTEDEDAEFEILPNRIDGFKINIFENIRRPMVQRQFKTHLDASRKRYQELFQKRHKLDYLGIDGVANFAKYQYIISRCTYHNGKRWNWSSESMYSILDYYYKNIIPDEKIRDICKHQPWSSMWSSRKVSRGLFDRPAYKLTSDQSRLVYWSQLYESAYQQQECDPKYLMEDDDVFDGWLLARDKNMKADQANFIKNPKIANSQEVYVNSNIKGLGSVKEQAREISGLNTVRGQNIVRNRFQRLDKEGAVKQQQFQDVRDRQFEK